MTIDYQRLERNLARDFRQFHVTAQIYRVVGVFLGALSLQLADGWHDWTWKGVYALLAAAAYGTLRQVAPQVPWKLVLQHMRWAQAAAEHQAAVDAVAKTSVPPAAETVYTPVTGPAVSAEKTVIVSEPGPELVDLKPGAVVATPKPAKDVQPPGSSPTTS